MKTVLLALVFLAQAALGQENNWNWSWTAPDPPLPDTEWWDYGWDSTSNGPAPAVEEVQLRRAIAPIRLTQGHNITNEQDRVDLHRGEPKAVEKESYLSDISVSPYATVAFEHFDGKARTGAGVELAVGASRTVSFVTFAETDNAGDSFIDRAGIGLRVTGSLGPRFHPFAGLLGGYAFDEARVDSRGSEPWFLRPQFGVGIDLVRYEGWLVQLKAAWGLDVSTHGEADQRLTGFLSVGKRF